MRACITKLTVAFRNFAIPPENGKEKPIKRHGRSKDNVI
jgi:hypothetical protein